MEGPPVDDAISQMDGETMVLPSASKHEDSLLTRQTHAWLLSWHREALSGRLSVIPTTGWYVNFDQWITE